MSSVRKVFLDTNILLDVALAERPGWAAANLLLDEIAYGKIQGLISSHSLKDVYFIMTKYVGEAAAREYLRAMIEVFQVVAVDEGICRLALESDEPDFEDGIIRACAEAAHSDVIVSRDVRAFSRSTIRRMSAREYVDTFVEYAEVPF